MASAFPRAVEGSSKPAPVLQGSCRIVPAAQTEVEAAERLTAHTPCALCEGDEEAVRLELLGHQDTDPTVQDTPIHQAMTLQGVEIKEEEVRGGEWGTGRCSFKAGEGRLVALPAPHMLGPRSP